MSQAHRWGIAVLITVAVSLALSPNFVSALPSNGGATGSPPVTASSTRCGVTSSAATFETPGVEVYYKQLRFNEKTERPRRQLIACTAPAHAKRVIGTINEFSRQEVKEGFSESIEINGLIAGRYLWVTLGRTVPDSGFAEAELFDLQTGRHVSARLQNFALSVATAGELVTFKEYLEECMGCEDPEAPKTLMVTSLAGGKVALETAVGIESVAASEQEIYWLSGKTVKSAAVPVVNSARSANVTHLATVGTGATSPVIASTRVGAATGRCEVLGTKTLYRVGGSTRVLRKPNGAILACSDTAGKLVVLNSVLPGVTATGPPTNIEPLSVGSMVAYRFPARTANGAVTALVVMDAVTGKVIRSTLAPATITDWVAGPTHGGASKTIMAYTEGSTLTVVDSAGTHEVDAGTISELAITPCAGTPSSRFQLYWTNAGAPKTRSIG